LARIRVIKTNFSKGELSPLVEGRPDVAAYFEGGKTIENFLLLRQGGLVRRPGLRYIAEVKTSSKDTVLLPFESSDDDAFAVEAGDLYLRFYKNKAQVVSGTPIEVASPYTEAQLRQIHLTQSVDIMYLFHKAVQQRRLSRVSDTSWVLSAITFEPPPSFEKDTDISLGSATLTPAATTGTGINFTASAAVFLNGDVGRLIISGAARAVITGFTSTTIVVADIIDAFSAGAIAAGSWFLRLSPQTTLDPNIKKPINAQVTLVAGVAAFRAADVGKFIVIYGGLIQITNVDSTTQIRGTILSELDDGLTSADPAVASAGAWNLEVASWSTTNGFPRTGEFFQGRLVQAGTVAEPTAFWLSGSDNFENYAIGLKANNAIEYTIAARRLNAIQWIADHDDMFVGTSGAEFRLAGDRNGEPIGGDTIPLVRPFGRDGSAPIQQVTLGRRVFFVDRSRRKIFAIAFNIEEDTFDSPEVTVMSEHITESGIRLGQIAVQNRLDPLLYFVRTDGTLVTLTFYRHEKIIGFTRLVTDGTFESVVAIPQVGGGSDHVYVIVKRTINGQTKRYVELFDDNASEFSTRLWKTFQTDCAVAYSGVSTSTISGLTHLEAKTVDVIIDGSYVGTKVVTGGQITLDAPATKVEVGLHYDSKAVTMRPAVANVNIEGLPRSWNKLWLRLFETRGGRVNGEALNYLPGMLDQIALFTGDKSITGHGWDTEGRVTIEQTQPYPMTVLAVFGELSLGDHG
jgi:hypothetical protein